MSKKVIGIIGANGRLGQSICQYYASNPMFEIRPFTRADFDLRSTDSVREGLTRAPCDVLVHCAAMTDVDLCEKEPEMAERLNGTVLRDVVWAADQTDAHVILIGTDYVFEGDSRVPYTETDVTAPLSAYGKSKLLGENCLFEHSDAHTVLRVSWLFGAAKPAFPEWILGRAFESDTALPVVGDKWGTITLAEDVSRLIEPLLLEPKTAKGIFNLCNTGTLSWADYGRLVLNVAHDLGLPVRTREIDEVKMDSISAFLASRPVYSALSTRKFEECFQMQPLTAEAAMRAHLQRTLPNYSNHTLTN